MISIRLRRRLAAPSTWAVADLGQNASGGTIVWALQPLADAIYRTDILPLKKGA
jgi:hypothetical protein